MTSRRGLGSTTFALLLGALVLFNPARGQGQAPQLGPSMPLPLAVDLDKIPVGSWSEYRITAGANKMSVRMALVTRSARSANVETKLEGGPISDLGSTTVRMSLPLEPSDEVKPTEQVIQLGKNMPMLLPAELVGSQTQRFRKLDPKKRVGVESITVAGGVFPQADHYRDQTAGGDTFDFWISRSVMPFGLLKVTSGSGTADSVAMELTGHGKGAKPIITKTPQPFDPAVILKQTQKAAPGAAPPGSGSGGPPPPTIPSPHPGMPPTPASAAGAGAKARQPGRAPGKAENKVENKVGEGKTPDSPARQNLK